MKIPITSIIIVAALVFFLAILFSGCANIPFNRTYSLSYSDGKQSMGMSLKLEAADSKRIKPLR